MNINLLRFTQYNMYNDAIYLKLGAEVIICQTLKRSNVFLKSTVFITVFT